MNVGDLKDETEAKKSLPSMVTLLVDNKKIKDVTAKIKNGAFDGNTAGSYTFVGTVKIPEGYAYSNGTLTAKPPLRLWQTMQRRNNCQRTPLCSMDE